MKKENDNIQEKHPRSTIPTYTNTIFTSYQDEKNARIKYLRLMGNYYLSLSSSINKSLQTMEQNAPKLPEIFDAFESIPRFKANRARKIIYFLPVISLSHCFPSSPRKYLRVSNDADKVEPIQRSNFRIASYSDSNNQNIDDINKYVALFTRLSTNDMRIVDKRNELSIKRLYLHKKIQVYERHERANLRFLRYTYVTDMRNYYNHHRYKLESLEKNLRSTHFSKKIVMNCWPTVEGDDKFLVSEDINNTLYIAVAQLNELLAEYLIPPGNNFVYKRKRREKLPKLKFPIEKVSTDESSEGTDIEDLILDDLWD